MRLSFQSCVAYLLERQLLSVSSIVDGDLCVLDASSRNLNLKVIRTRSPSYLVKQPGAGDTQDAVTVRHEAAFYRLVHEDPEFLPLSEFLPKYHHFEPGRDILIIECLMQRELLHEHYQRLDRFSEEPAIELGKALAILHSRPLSKVMNNAELSFFGPGVPWILYVHRPVPEVLESASAANIQIVRIVQKYAEFGAVLDSLREQSRVECLIHADVKWTNCLVKPEYDGGNCDLKLIDWELVQAGDPAWDVGSVFSDYLGFWLLSLPVTGGSAPERFLELTRYPLEMLQPAIRGFWRSYSDARNANDAACDELLVRSMKYCAARLVQTAYERTQMSMLLTGSIICLLQLSLNILKRPEAAIHYLLGL